MTRADERKIYLEIGICPICKKRTVEPNKHACYECLDRERMRYREKQKNGTYNQKINTERKRTRANQLKEQGVCYKCGKRKAVNGGACNFCRAKMKRYRDRYRQDVERSERPSCGKCYICGKEELFDGHKVCMSCYEKRLQTIPAMLTNKNNEFFRMQNNLHYIIYGNKKMKKERSLVGKCE